MVEKIIWRKKALVYVRETAEYLEREFSFQAAENFVESVTKAIARAEKNPTTYRKAMRTKSVHVINIDKTRQMFYRLSGKTLIISAFFDARQDPNKRPF
jgi:plasmid stabilization system protein ParE